MIGGKLGRDFIERAQKEGARLIITGDIRQLSSPTAGHFLKYVTRYTNVKTVELDKSLRQKDNDLARGVELLNSIKVEKLGESKYTKTAKNIVEKAMFHFNNSILEFKTPEAKIKHAAEEYLKLSKPHFP